MNEATMYPGPLPPGQTSLIPIKDWSPWQHINEFTVLDAACLWVGIWPLVDLKALQCSPDAAMRYRLLADAIQAGTLGNYPRRWFNAPEVGALWENDGPQQRAYLGRMLLSRQELESYAMSIKEAPLFLFPAPVKDSVHERRGALPASTTGPRRPRKRDPKAQMTSERKRKLIWIEVNRRWPDKTKRPTAREMARELCNENGREKLTAYSAETVRKILSERSFS